MRLTFGGVGAGAYVLNVTSVSGVEFTGPTGAFPLSSPMTLTFTRRNNSNDSGDGHGGGDTIQPAQGAVCGQGTFTFRYTRP